MSGITPILGLVADELDESRCADAEREANTWRTAVLRDGVVDFTSGDKCGSFDDARTQIDEWHDSLDACDREDGTLVVVHMGEVVHVAGQESTVAELRLLARAAQLLLRPDCHGRFEALYWACGELRAKDEEHDGDYLAAAAQVDARWTAEMDAIVEMDAIERDCEAAAGEAVAS